MNVDIPKGKNWLAKGLLQALVITLTIVGTIAVKDAPGHSETTEERLIEQLQRVTQELQATAVSNANRITKLETLMDSMRSVPEAMAYVKATLDAVKTTVDDTKRKVDTHVSK